MEKEKNKRGDMQRVSKRTTFISLAIILSIAFLSAAFFLFHAYGLLEIYQALSIPIAIVLTIFLLILLLIGFFIVRRFGDAIVLVLAIFGVCGCALSGAAGVLAWFSPFILPLLLIILVGFVTALIFRPEPFSFSEFIVSLAIASVFTINLILLQDYIMMSYRIHESTNINGRSYHLISDDGSFDPTLIRLYECNTIGLFCEEIYKSNRSYDWHDDEFTWAITDEGAITITVFINNNEVYQYQIE